MEKKELEQLLWDGWVKDKDYVFVSYSSQDWEKVYPCVFELRTMGINVFIDLEFRENSSSSWLRNLEERMIRSFECKGVISFVSTSYLGSYACLTELIANRTNKQIRRKGAPLPVFYVALEQELRTPQQIDNYIRQETIRAKLNHQTVRIEPTEYTKMENFLLGCRFNNYPDRPAVQDLLDDIHTRFDVAALMYELIFSDMPSIQPFENAAECAGLLRGNFVNDKNESIKLPVLDNLQRETNQRLDRFMTETAPDNIWQTELVRSVENQSPTSAKPEGANPPQKLERTRVGALRLQAEQGDAAAQFNLGVCYANGRSVERDLTQAVQWYRKAAEQGHAGAQCNLGVCYELGRGVAKDPTQAAQWYCKAAEQGHAKAQFSLGVCYEDGRGVEQDWIQAVNWYHKAAEQGHAKAQYKLGVCYANGRGVEQDRTQAVQWYRRAAEQSNADAQYNLGWCYANGKGVEQDQAQAIQWYCKAAEKGNAKAQCNLGVCYELGRGVEQDQAQAIQWYCKAAEKGNAAAQYNLGLCYEFGRGVEQDQTQAVQWYRKAAEQGHTKAQEKLDKLGI